ncbi:MAG: hypothetical protein ABIH56_00990 [Candidatus Margulisiibacteriota bacterium]
MKKLTALLFVLTIALSFAARAAVPYEPKSTAEELIAKIGVIRLARQAGKFIRLSPETLKFEGYIVRESYPEYLKNIDDRVKVLLVNSPGGDTYSGVKMGLDIMRRKLTVIVEGTAASSAANYLFLGGEEKIIAKGFVGFHGNSRAMVAQAGGFDKLKKEMQARYKISDEYFATFKREQEETIGLEKEFYGKINVSQKLFDLTQEPGKGVSVASGEGFDFLLPSLRTMEDYGIKNVSGAQDVDLAEKLGIKVIYY